MAIEGYATVEGTRRYRERMVAAGKAHPNHFSEELGGLSLASIGLGTYLGGYDARTDSLYLEGMKQAAHLRDHLEVARRAPLHPDQFKELVN
ncbi:MAG: hypothetical protein ACE5MM_06080 [Nitrospiraceae bacterium]